LAQTEDYARCNHQHFTELLAEREAIGLSRSTVRRCLLAAGLRSPRRRKAPRHRGRRERMAQEGMLLQIDGSPYRWLGPDGPQWCLISGVDDATGPPEGAVFLSMRMRQATCSCSARSLSRKAFPLPCTGMARQLPAGSDGPAQSGRGTGGSVLPHAVRAAVGRIGDRLHCRWVAAGKGPGRAALAYPSRPVGDRTEAGRSRDYRGCERLLTGVPEPLSHPLCGPTGLTGKGLRAGGEGRRPRPPVLLQVQP